MGDSAVIQSSTAVLIWECSLSKRRFFAQGWRGAHGNRNYCNRCKRFRPA